MSNNKQKLLYLIFVVILSLISIFSNLMGCKGYDYIKSEAYQYLRRRAELSLSYLEENKGDYYLAAQRKAEYEKRLIYLESGYFYKSPDFYSDVVYLIGYWGIPYMTNVCYKFYPVESIESYTYPNLKPTYLDYAYIERFYNRLKDILLTENELNWSTICESEYQRIIKDIDLLYKLIDIWELEHQKWKVSRIGDRQYILSGNYLGIDNDNPCYGEWVYEVNIFEPNSYYSKNLKNLVSRYYESDYETKKASNKKYERLLDIKDRWFKYINNWSCSYDFSEGLGSFTNTLPNRYKKGSNMWKKIIEETYYRDSPEVKRYVEIFEEIGFIVKLAINHGSRSGFEVYLVVEPYE